ncbi:MAG: hypothetical protein CMM75_02210 [Rhodospirillaceae bacterium]|nr:hypothetical protein [Rhodospirillaceae bacterium]|tara:strand:- start:38 stop:688 length:651 start_codon:yes stop_codon:yes gene_type:complete
MKIFGALVGLKFFKLSVFSALLLVGCSTNDAVMFESNCFNGKCIHPLESIQSTKLSKIKFVKQIDQKGCGAATLSSVLNYWNKKVSYDTIMSEFPSVSNEGYSIGELKSIAIRYNLFSYSASMSLKFLKNNLKKGRPVIIAVKKAIFKYTDLVPDFLPLKDFITYSHFMIVFGFNNNGYWVIDPAEGYKYLASDQLFTMWERHNFAGLLISSRPQS